MKTAADLKRDLKVGKILKPLYHFKGDKMMYNREIIHVQSNSIKTKNIDDSTKQQGTWMDLPKASLLAYTSNNIFSIYEAGERPLTEQEKSIINNAPSKLPENAEQCRIDLISDGSQMFYRDNSYFKEKGAEYLRHVYGDTIKDAKVKGTKLYTFEIV